jgi:hypothetical protein
MTQLSICPVSPLPGEQVEIETGAGACQLLKIVVQITLSCGCPTCAGGRFDASRFRVDATVCLARGGCREARLSYSGRASEFAGTIEVPGPRGRLTIEVRAYDPETGMAGRMSWDARLC